MVEIFELNNARFYGVWNVGSFREMGERNLEVNKQLRYVASR